MVETEDIGDCLDCKDYPVLVHNTRLIQRSNILKYLKKIIVKGLYKPKETF
jgi:hypothetical protein